MWRKHSKDWRNLEMNVWGGSTIYLRRKYISQNFVKFSTGFHRGHTEKDMLPLKALCVDPMCRDIPRCEFSVWGNAGGSHLLWLFINYDDRAAGWGKSEEYNNDVLYVENKMAFTSTPQGLPVDYSLKRGLRQHTKCFSLFPSGCKIIQNIRSGSIIIMNEWVKQLWP